MGFEEELKAASIEDLLESLSIWKNKMLSFLDTPIDIYEVVEKERMQYNKKVAIKEKRFVKTRVATVDDIPTVDKDMYALHLIELSRRTGMNKEDIEKILKNDRFLAYKNGEEKFFIL